MIGQGHSRSDAPCGACGDLDGCHRKGTRIYVASSWRNSFQPAVVDFLRRMGGREIYDFRNPEAGNHGFSWTSIDEGWRTWTAAQYRDALEHPNARQGHELDFEAMRWCDTCVLVLPAGRSASYELGYCMGAGKRGIVFIPSTFEPELMYRGAEIVVSFAELGAAFGAKAIPGAAVFGGR